MIKRYFDINYLFDIDEVWGTIDGVIERQEKGYIVVADGVVVNNVQRIPEYRQTVDGSLFAICDSSWVPLYLKLLYGVRYPQYCGAQILKDSVLRHKHRQCFLGTSQGTLDGLKSELSKWNPEMGGMLFYELPYLKVEEFDYPAIAKMIKDDGADIIWVALGAPKQDYFMERLLPYLDHGVMLGVGAAFKFYSGTCEKRAPKWMVKAHMEFLYRISQDPKKQLKRCWGIVSTLPGMLWREWKRKRAYIKDEV